MLFRKVSLRKKNTRKRCFQGGNVLEMRFFRACGGQKWVYTGQMRAVGARKNLTQNWASKWGLYPNLGLNEPEPDGKMVEKVDDLSFGKTIKKYLELEPMVIGACCGSNPKHTDIIYKLINQ